MRINNIIESEIKPRRHVAAATSGRLWQLSFLQLARRSCAIAVVSSLLTVVAYQKLHASRRGMILRRVRLQRRRPSKSLLVSSDLIETPQQARDRRIKEQQAAIEYWNARVQARRCSGTADREAFDRNLQVIDESVNEYTMILAEDPDDELSGEMLDSVLNDKMNLLRDFSDL